MHYLQVLGSINLQLGSHIPPPCQFASSILKATKWIKNKSECILTSPRVTPTLREVQMYIYYIPNIYLIRIYSVSTKFLLGFEKL
jgi:hypothetical protein